MDTVALMVILYYSYRCEKSPDKPEAGPFRIKREPPAADEVSTPPAKLRSARRR
ncbi:MAG: hypothetical protein RQ966_12350 [Acetobacteraceae bacterium]|nr:hypothetical protein [Acetobacteraceae bacterium]